MKIQTENVALQWYNKNTESTKSQSNLDTVHGLILLPYQGSLAEIYIVLLFFILIYEK